MHNMKILLVEDDSPLADTVTEFLTDNHCLVTAAEDGEAGLDRFKKGDFSLVLLDVMLPKVDGIELCKRIRAEDADIPIIMITARDTSTDKITGLDAGADDYIVKPIDLPEMLARIRALMRRVNAPIPMVLRWGDLQVDLNVYEVTYQDRVISLTPKEFGILELLLRHGYNVLRRHVIVEHVWSLDDPPKEDTINTNIKSLRNKLKAAGAPPDLIETIHSVGYRLKRNSDKPAEKVAAKV
jgi:DNA-binding response OmpR family regulator